MSKKTTKIEIDGDKYPAKSIDTKLPAHAAQSYICDMLGELIKIADSAQLEDVAALLSLTVAAAKISAK